MPGRRSSTRLSFLLLALACAAAAPASAQIAVPPRTQPVMPNVVGMSESEAMSRLAQFGVQAQTRAIDSSQPRGTVVRQSPAAGTAIKQGAVAVLGVSTGPARPSDDGAGQTQPTGDGGVRPPPPGLVPDVTGMSLTMARIRLVASGLRAGAVDSGSVEGARPGRVIAQDPLPGTQVVPGRSVRLTLQRRAPVAPQPPVDPTPTRPDPPPPPASTLVTVPDLSGRTVSEARTMVGGARLLLGGVDGDSTSSARPGTVVRQRPAAGESVEAGTLVTVTVAREALVVVPRLTGRSPSEARRELARAGLRPGSLTEREAPGQPAVMQQSVPAGSRVRRGTVVDLVVSVAPTVRPDTPVAAAPPAAPPAQPPAVDSAPAAQPATPVDTVATQPPAAVVPTPAPSAVTVPAPAATPAASAPRPGPAAGTTPRWDILAIIAALLLAIAGGLYWRSRVRRVVPRQTAPAAASPVVPTVTIRTAGGDSRAGSQPETPVNDGRVKVGVIVGAARAPVPEPGAAALQPARVVVRMVEDETEDALGAHPQRVMAGAAMQVRAAAAEPRLERDEGAVILRRTS
ncbi:MAG: PASTA domain-containing protein [Longimicrobiaceae bacterium]